MPTLLIRVPTIIDFYLTAVSQFTVSILKGRNLDTSDVDVTFSVCGADLGVPVHMCPYNYVCEIGRNVTKHSVYHILN